MKKNFWIIGLAVLIIAGCDFLDSLSGDKPRVPVWVIATPQANLSIQVTWEEISKADSYDVYYEADSNPDVMQRLVNVTEASYTHEDLNADTTYTYFVRAKNSAGTSNYAKSNATRPIEVDNRPSAPYYVYATAKSNLTIEVTWAAVSNATSYAVYFETDSSSDKQHLGDTAETSYTHTGLNSGTTYTYYIKAKNSDGESDFSTKSNSTKPIEAPAGGTSPTDAITITQEGVTGMLLLSSSERWYTFTGNGSGTLFVKDKGNASSEYSADIAADIYTTAPSTGSDGVFAKINNFDAEFVNLGAPNYSSITQNWTGTFYVRVYLYPGLLNGGTFWLSFE